MTSASLRKAVPSLALYEQIKEHIMRKIRDGSWGVGQRLPSEHELVAQFGISRMTANRALRELVEQGRIVRVAGVGSFVAENKPQSTLLQIANIASEIRARGHDYGYRLLAAERSAASTDVAAWLDLRAGESVFHSLCLTSKTACRCSWKTVMSIRAWCPTSWSKTSPPPRPASTWCATCPSTRSSTWSTPCCPPPSRPSVSRCRRPNPACC